jgi:hypothetical protein
MPIANGAIEVQLPHLINVTCRRALLALSYVGSAQELPAESDSHEMGDTDIGYIAEDSSHPLIDGLRNWFALQSHFQPLISRMVCECTSMETSTDHPIVQVWYVLGL